MVPVSPRKNLAIADLMVRIVILGCAGGGKTTLARQLGGRTGAFFRSLIIKAHAGDQWIRDGSFALATFDIRLTRATLVIWLESSKRSCAWRAITRVFKRGRAHRIGKLPEVRAFLWKFDRVHRPRIEAVRASHGPEVPVLTLTGSPDIANFLPSYGAGAHDPIQD